MNWANILPALVFFVTFALLTAIWELVQRNTSTNKMMYIIMTLVLILVGFTYLATKAGY